MMNLLGGPPPANSSSHPLGLHNMLRRRRSAGTNVANQQAGITSSVTPTASSPVAYRIRLVPQLESRRSLRFEAITRDLREGDPPLRIGRFTDRTGLGLAAANALATNNKLAFKSKVVSRTHAEIWVESGGKFFVKDTKSSSGTFLNHSRLSPANAESRPFPIRDGDILQLGVDYQGGAEDIYRCVKIRVEIGREWQEGANAFNTNALRNLKSIATPKPGKKSILPDCCICLFGVTIRQALFIAPCSHTFHYKCIRPMLEVHHPAFNCPLCRTFADLDEDVEVEVEGVWEGEGEGEGDVVMESDEHEQSERERERERERGAETEVEGEKEGVVVVVVVPPRVKEDESMVLVDVSEGEGEGSGSGSESKRRKR